MHIAMRNDEVLNHTTMVHSVTLSNEPDHDGSFVGSGHVNKERAGMAKNMFQDQEHLGKVKLLKLCLMLCNFVHFWNCAVLFFFPLLCF